MLDLWGLSLTIKKAIFHAGCCCFALCLGPAWSPMPPLGSRSCKLHEKFQIAHLLYLTARPPTKTAMLLGAAALHLHCCFITNNKNIHYPTSQFFLYH